MVASSSLFYNSAFADTPFLQQCPPSLVHSTNRKLLPVLNELVKTSVFRYFKANLQKECPFWQENLLCTLEDCSVLQAKEEEVPESFRREIEKLSAVDYSAPSNGGSGLFGGDHGGKPAIKKCNIKEEDFCLMQDIEDEDGIFINLLNNPERYTGYAGDSAARVWTAIYKENCFPSTTYLEEEESNGLGMYTANNGWLDVFSVTTTQEVCQEKKVFYKLVSGLHTSISLHICGDYLDRKRGVWSRNTTCYKQRFQGYPDRIENLYFLWSVLVRSVSKLSPYLSNYPFCEGSEDELFVRKHVDQVMEAINACPGSFHENELFRDQDAKSLKNEFKQRFRNISQIMDCVGCEKCRLWGKVQVTGLGTALKVLFSYSPNASKYRLTRPELVSLINLFNRVAESVNLLEYFEARIEKEMLDVDEMLAAFERGHTFYIGLVLVVVGLGRIIYLGYNREMASRIAVVEAEVEETKKKS